MVSLSLPLAPWFELMSRHTHKNQSINSGTWSGWDGSAPENLDYVILGDSFSVEVADALSIFDRLVHAFLAVHVPTWQDNFVLSFLAQCTHNFVGPVHEFELHKTLVTEFTGLSVFNASIFK